MDQLILIFPLVVILVLLKIAELNKQSEKTRGKSYKKYINEGFKTDKDNSELSSSDNAYKPNFTPVHIDHEKYGASSEIDPEIALSKDNILINNIYGVDPPQSGQSDKDDILYIYDKLSGSVDLGMANVMSAVSKRSKESQTNKNRTTRNTWNKYFTDELNDHENRVWWDNSELDMAF